MEDQRFSVSVELGERGNSLLISLEHPRPDRKSAHLSFELPSLSRDILTGKFPYHSSIVHGLLTAKGQPFMIAQKESQPWGYMTAYSRLRGTHCPSCPPKSRYVVVT
jgi:hypothetical protein